MDIDNGWMHTQTFLFVELVKALLENVIFLLSFVIVVSSFYIVFLFHEVGGLTRDILKKNGLNQ